MQFCLDLIWLQMIIVPEASLKALYIFLDSAIENTSVANLTSHWISLLFHTNPLGIVSLAIGCFTPNLAHSLWESQFPGKPPASDNGACHRGAREVSDDYLFW